ncbi:hypothetical protein BBJ29_007196 [Phytophthora kernoviae]|uniref:RRM domain-containing protein n=1 Tax=Phytophthora kernoviae TaxID=325452 RepID=A0A3F2RGQ2_9STRA|nr:hypothetical protein BBJ29_007196 [Phytophthora kernoviae]RLN56490.1 hypothetical protein BBP00_00007965 [Phytophthora kernoviae]
MPRVYVGNLPEGVRERDLSDQFERFGRLISVRIKFPARPPPFAFLEYEDDQAASDAVRSMNGGLPDSMSWQDLKDFLRKGGDVVHSDVDRRGNGTASFATPDEMRRAIRKLDGSDLDGETVRVREEAISVRFEISVKIQFAAPRWWSQQPTLSISFPLTKEEFGVAVLTRTELDDT